MNVTFKQTCVRGIALLGATLVVCACSATPPVEEVVASFELPEAWSNAGEVDAVVDDPWCSGFDDPALIGLIAQVYDRNMDLAVAEARVRQARGVYVQARGQRMPSLRLEGEVESVREAQGWEHDLEFLTPELSYEVDLWGRVRALSQASDASMRAVGLDLRALRMVLAAETAEHFYDLVRHREALLLLDAQLEAANTFLELTEVRRAQGMANAIDVIQQRQQIERLRELQIEARLNAQLARQGLALLLGEPPGKDFAESSVTLPEVVRAGVEIVPADLLTRRPDVMAARWRAVAADRRVHAALAERLPRLELSASLMVQATSVKRLFDYLFVVVGGKLSQSVFEGGAAQGRVDASRAASEAALMAFSAVLLEAIGEVESSLARGRAQYEILASQQAQLTNARQALELAREQYRAGILDYLRVLNALQSVQQLELAIVNSRREAISHRVQLCRAVGGLMFQDALDEEL